jgi:hypothetical protein
MTSELRLDHVVPLTEFCIAEWWGLGDPDDPRLRLVVRCQRCDEIVTEHTWDVSEDEPLTASIRRMARRHAAAAAHHEAGHA